MFAYEIYDLEPDIMTLGKGIGWVYSAQPLGMAVVYAVVKEIYDKKLYVNSQKQGEYIKNKLEVLSKKILSTLIS